MDSILWPIFGTAETSHISPPDAILDELHLFSSVTLAAYWKQQLIICSILF